MGKVRAPSMRKTLSGPMRTSAARSDDGNIRRRTASQKFIIVNHIAERQQHKRNRLAHVNGYGRRLCNTSVEAETGGVKILWLLVHACSYQHNRAQELLVSGNTRQTARGDGKPSAGGHLRR